MALARTGDPPSPVRLPLRLLGLFLALVAAGLAASPLLGPEAPAGVTVAIERPAPAPEAPSEAASAPAAAPKAQTAPEAAQDAAPGAAPRAAPGAAPGPETSGTEAAEPAPAATAPERAGQGQQAALPPASPPQPGAPPAEAERPWRVYARPFDETVERPRVAIVLTGLGLSSAATETAIQGLPGAVTLSFTPYADSLDGWIRLARAAGHEVLLDLPMEPLNFPDFDPGPQALLTSLSTEENLRRLDWALSRATSGYVGAVANMGSHFTASKSDLRPILAALAARGLMFVDNRASRRSAAPELARALGLPYAANRRFIDEHASRAAIDARLKELEELARESGKALGIAAPYPVTLERLADWASSAERRGIAVAPASAVVEDAGAAATARREN